MQSKNVKNSYALRDHFNMEIIEVPRLKCPQRVYSRFKHVGEHQTYNYSQTDTNTD